MSESLEATERECAAGRTAPRVALDDIINAIASVHYRSAADAMGVATHAQLRLLTLCVMVMKNGFTIVGKSAPASAENYEYKLGCKLAYEDAVRQAWPLMGFTLRDRLAFGDGQSIYHGLRRPA